MKSKTPIKVVLANSNMLLLNGIKAVLASSGCKVVFETDSGKALLNKLKTKPPVDLLVLDINLKQVNGFDLVKELNTKYPTLKILVVSQFTHPYTLNYMFHYGVRGFVNSNVDEKSIIKAVNDIHTKGYHYNKLTTKQSVIDAISEKPDNITARQVTFLECCCTEMNYYDMANKMKVSSRTIDWYRDIMFERFKLTNRADLVLFSLRTGLVSL